MLHDGFTSFVGQYPIPMRHGMTIGELAKLFNEHFGIGAKLEVVAMQGWSRATWWDGTGLPWVLPSPNIPTFERAIVYPGTCLFEGTNLSEGRGTTHPFELIGAPWLDERRLASTLNHLALPGVEFQPFCFRPTFNKHANERCHGVRIRVIESQCADQAFSGFSVDTPEDLARAEAMLREHLKNG